MITSSIAQIWLLLLLTTGTSPAADLALSYTSILSAHPTQLACLSQVVNATTLAKKLFPTMTATLRCQPVLFVNPNQGD